MSQTPDAPAWIGVILTALAGVAGAVKAFFSLATKREVAAALKEVEVRFANSVSTLNATLIRLHEENKEARHELANSLSGPIMALTKELAELRGEFKGRRDERGHRDD